MLIVGSKLYSELEADLPKNINIMANPEYKAMVECNVVLVTEIANDPDTIAHALFQKKLIAQGILEKMDLPIPRSSKSSQLVECVRKQVSNFPKEVFPVFLDVLRSHLWLERVAQTLEDKLGMFNHKNYSLVFLMQSCRCKLIAVVCGCWWWCGVVQMNSQVAEVNIMVDSSKNRVEIVYSNKSKV